MTGRTLPRPTPEQLEAHRPHRTACALAREQRKRDRALVTLASFPAGTGPLPTLSENDLRALAARGLAERRYVLTPEGRRAAERLNTEGAA